MIDERGPTTSGLNRKYGDYTWKSLSPVSSINSDVVLQATPPDHSELLFSDSNDSYNWPSGDTISWGETSDDTGLGPSADSFNAFMAEANFIDDLGQYNPADQSLE